MTRANRASIHPSTRWSISKAIIIAFAPEPACAHRIRSSRSWWIGRSGSSSFRWCRDAGRNMRNRDEILATPGSRRGVLLTEIEHSIPWSKMPLRARGSSKRLSATWYGGNASKCRSYCNSVQRLPVGELIHSQPMHGQRDAPPRGSMPMRLAGACCSDRDSSTNHARTVGEDRRLRAERDLVGGAQQSARPVGICSDTPLPTPFGSRVPADIGGNSSRRHRILRFLPQSLEPRAHVLLVTARLGHRLSVVAIGLTIVVPKRKNAINAPKPSLKSYQKHYGCRKSRDPASPGYWLCYHGGIGEPSYPGTDNGIHKGGNAMVAGIIHRPAMMGADWRFPRRIIWRRPPGWKSSRRAATRPMRASRRDSASMCSNRG